MLYIENNMSITDLMSKLDLLVSEIGERANLLILELEYSIDNDTVKTMEKEVEEFECYIFELFEQQIINKETLSYYLFMVKEKIVELNQRLELL